MPQFLIQKEVAFGLCIYIVHSLNDWSLQQALKLKWNEVSNTINIFRNISGRDTYTVGKALNTNM